MSGLYGNATGGFGNPKTYILTDNNGKEITGVLVDNVTVFDATPEDVRVDKVFASDEGVQTGVDTKTYRTTMGSKVILKGESFSIPLVEYDGYNYTQFNAMISSFNTTISDSISVNKISINDSVYAVNSTTKLADVTKNSSTKSIDLNIVNNTNGSCVIHYSTYKEE